MAPPHIEAQTFFGLRTDIQGNAHFTTDSEVVYPAGGVLVLHDFNQKCQKFIKLPEKQNPIQSISISPNKQFILLNERANQKDKKPTIKIYDLSTLELKKSLTIPFEEITCTQFVAVHFTWDSKYVVAVTGEPDWMLYYYNWESGKIESQTKAQNPNGQGRVTQVNCNLTDANVIVITGAQTFRLMNVSETVWRQWGWTKAENLIITSCMWLTPDKVMFGTKFGVLMIVENGELRQSCNYRGAEILEISTKKDDKELDTVSQAKQELESSEAMEIRCLTVFPKGFAFSSKSGYVHMFEKESRFKWIKRNVFKVIDCPFRINERESIDLNFVQHISVNDNQDTLIITTLKSQIYYVKLYEEHMDQVSEIPFLEMGERLHHSRINGLAMCSWKPIFMTSGEDDRSIRLWNYETMKLEFVKFYHENVNCVSLHPTGLFAVIGFADKLRYMVVLIDDLYQMREFSIRNCKVCKFSNNGHMFAAVDNMIIQVFSSISFNNVFNLKGHSGIIRALSWAGRDDKIVSCGSDGAIYEWSMMTSQRVSEVIMKSNDFTGCSATSDGKSSYIVGIDGEVKEARNDTVIRNLKIIGVQLDNIALAHSDMMLFVTGGKGVVVSIQFPLLDKAVFKEYRMHNRNVTAIALSYDDRTLISVAEDATICIWRLDNSEGKAIVLGQDFCYSEEILIHRDDLREKIMQITELSKRISEMETEHAYQVRQMVIKQNENLVSIHANYSNQIEGLSEKIEVLDTKNLQQTNDFQDNINKINSDNDEAVEMMEVDFNSKLIFEYSKYEELNDNISEMKNDYKHQLKTLEQSKVDALNELQVQYEMQLNEKNNMIKELTEKNDLELREHEYIKQTIEDDADREIVELKATYASQLRDEKHSNVVLKGETDVLKKKIVLLQTTIEDYKIKVALLNGEVKQAKDFVKVLEAKMSDLRKEISNRDKTIQDKDRDMQNVRLENQSLENYKFVLSFKLDELSKQTEPKDEEIQQLKMHIKSLEANLRELLEMKERSDVEITGLKEKLWANQSDKNKQSEEIYDLKTTLKRIHDEIAELSLDIQNPAKLKTAVKELLQYKCDGILTNKSERSLGIVEYKESKQSYENQISCLMQKLECVTLKSKKDAVKLMEDNSELLNKINVFRNELKDSNEQCKKLKTLLGLPAARVNPSKARLMIDKACTDYESIEREFNLKIQEKDRIIRQLKTENEELLKMNETN
ncbi:cilia- and flagella-associated protein 57-like [Arctopsyche grandis]|uniref:cilia- and flagella-associated protein 57-like n=1 Tax=Arctopsyche grandis TaxID=121162 RepID=UPI00406DA05E